MRKISITKIICIAFLALSNQQAFAQLPDGFDIKKAYVDAEAKGIESKFLDEYVEHEHALYLRKNSSKAIPHDHSQVGEPLDLGTIYLGGGNSNNYKGPTPTPQNIYCPNAGFEQVSFTNWSGATGGVTTAAPGAPFPIYTQTATSILNPAGNNTSIRNPQNFHTLLTTPATNNIYPNCVGWDSIACKVIGTQTVSEIPWVNPNGGPASVRLNGIHGFSHDHGSKLNYNMSLNPNNKSFSVSYAIVLYNGGHLSNDQPYFSVKITDQNGNLVPGCSVYTVTCNSNLTNTASPMYDPSWTDAVIGFGTMYRKWSTYAFDFSNYPLITSVNVEFYVGGCGLGGHWGYAYVDAACSPGGAVASFCAGSNTSVLTAPVGYSTYQWIGPSGPVSVGNGGNTGTATITPVTAGQVFTCNVTAVNGCLSSFQTTVAITTISITGVGSTPSCLGGNSGTANVNATGSSLGYSYAWVNSSGTPVGSTQAASGLSPGVYSVTVSSPLCGSQTTTVSVSISPPAYYGLNAPFCGSVGWINKPGGTNYKWYTATPLALIAGATSSSLTINSPVAGAQYFLVYTTPSGCKDSIKYTLTQTPGGSVYVSNIKSICAGNNNSYAVVNLQTAAPPVYSYSVTGPSGYSSILTNTTAVKDSVVGLSIGTYSVVVFDGQCLYNTTFTVSPFVFNYTLTPQTSTICSSGSTTLAVNFGNTTPTACGLSTSGGCSSPNLITIGTGAMANTSTSYPAIYGNFYKNTRHQILYRATELTAAGILPGKISSIAFNITTINGTTTYPDFTIKMKCTSATDLAGTAFDQVGLTQVFYSPAINITTGWNTYSFPTAYEWDGVSNILIDVCNSITTPNYTQNSITPYTITPFISVRWYNSDVTVACPIATGSSFAPNNTQRPNIRFQNCGGSNPALFTYTWTPTVGLSSTTGYTTVASPSSTTVYSVQVNPIGQTNCVQTQTAVINIINPASATITPVSALCTNASQVSLTVSPSGGTWSGVGITPSGVLTPSNAVVGNNTYSYSVGSGTCSSTGTTTISVERYVPSTITGIVVPQCITNSTINLATSLSTSTLGVGVWAGNGITGTVFSPTVAGVGSHTITYSTNSLPTTTLCPSSSSIVVTVTNIAQPVITPAGPYCDSFTAQSMTVTPTGGVWTSTNVATSISSSGILTPSTSNVGANNLIYTLTNGPCTATASAVVNIEIFVPSTITGVIAPQCITNSPINLLTALSTSTLGAGVWAINGVVGTVFSPTVAGVGSHTITYSTNSIPTTALCPSTSSIVVTVTNIAQPVITPAGPYCDSFTAQSMTATPTGGVWTSTNVATSISSSGVLAPNSTNLGANNLIYTLTNGACTSSATTVVNIEHFIAATITGALGPYCVYDAGGNLQATAQYIGGVWSGPGVTGSNFSPALATPGLHTITYSTASAPTAALCPDSKTLNIQVNDKPNANLLANIYKDCNPLKVDFSTTTVNTGLVVWNFGDGSPQDSGFIATHTYTVPGTYTASLIYTDPIGCQDSTTAPNTFTVFANPVASFNPSLLETTVVDGQIDFTNNSTVLNNNTYSWNIGGLATSTQTNTSYLFTNAGNYLITLVATSPDNAPNFCTDDTTIIVVIKPDVVLYVPNAFTPGNGDGLNDMFQIFLPPTGVDYSSFKLTIFDRWGEVIYRTTDVNQFWNGRKNNSGPILKQETYVWKIEFSDELKKPYEKLGHVTLLVK